MLILAAVRRRHAARLRSAAGGRFALQVATTWEGAVETIRRQPVEMAVLDPALEEPPRTHEIERIGVLFPSLPRIALAELTPGMVPVLLRLGVVGIREVILAGHDDHPSQVIETLTTAAARAVSRRLIDDLQESLAEWPDELRWAVETVLREPAQLHSVRDLAARARMDRRTCVRWFARANLPPPSVMLTVFRVVYAHRLLQDPGYTIEDVAAKLGYAKVRSFTQNVKDVFGMTPGELRVSLTADEAVDLVRERFFPAPSQRLRIVS